MNEKPPYTFFRYRSEGSQVSYIAIFAAILSLLVLSAIWANSRLGYFRERPINFHELPRQALVVEQGLTRAQAASMKLGFIENFQPPQTALFGNHQFQYFGEDAFDGQVGPDVFFNFWYADLSLTEIRDYLAYLSSIDKLPSRSVLVQITTPNNDNGQYILGYNGELPPDIAQFGQEAGNRLVKFQHWTSEARQTLLRIFNYSSLIIGALNSGFGSRIVITDQCEELDDAGVSGRFALWLPRVVRQFLGSIGVSAAYCDPRLWSHAYRRDGSHNGRYVKRNPVLNQNSLNQESIALGPEDSDELKAVLREISQIVSEKGRTIVFIIPPVYETPRYGISDRVLSEAFAALPELNLVDHRNLGQREDFFIRYDHPSEEYFRYLVAELIRLNFMDADHLSGSSQ